MFSSRNRLENSIPRLRRLAVALCRDHSAADDLVQDTLTRALVKQGLFDGANLPAWLSTVMVNLFRSGHRKFARQPVLVDLDNTEALSIGSKAQTGERQDIIRALAKLPDDQRVALLLLALEGYSYKDIAAIQGAPIGTVMSRIARARESMRMILGEDPKK